MSQNKNQNDSEGKYIGVLTHRNCMDGCMCRELIKKKLGIKNKISLNAMKGQWQESGAEESWDEYAQGGRTEGGDSVVFLNVAYEDFSQDIKPGIYQWWRSMWKEMPFKKIIMADFSLNREWLKGCIEKGVEIELMDHHEAAYNDARWLEEEIRQGRAKGRVVMAWSNEASAAKVVWNHYFKGMPLPKVVEYVSDGDLYEFKNPKTRGFYVGALEERQPKEITPQEWEEWLIDEGPWNEMVQRGSEKFAAYWAECEAIAEQASEITLKGRKGLAVRADLKYKSEVGNILAKKSGDFGLLWDIEDGIIKVSLRSVAPTVVSSLAKEFGGAGHPQAAAFRVANLEQWRDCLRQEGNQEWGGKEEEKKEVKVIKRKAGY